MTVDGIVQQTDGSFVVGLTVADQFVLEEFNADGSFNTSFGDGGIDFTGVYGNLAGIAAGPNGTPCSRMKAENNARAASRRS